MAGCWCLGRKEASQNHITGHKQTKNNYSLTPERQNPAQLMLDGVLNWDPGNDLLSHGLRPHYHRRRTFSLPSSERDRVVPARNNHQGIL